MPRRHVTGRPLDLTTHPTFPKAVGLVEIAGGKSLTLQDRRLFDTLLAVAYERIEKDEEHSVRLADLRRLAVRETAEHEHKGNERIKASIKRLKTLVVEFNVLDLEGTNWTYIESLLGSARFSENKEVLFYKFPEAMRPLLVDPALYARIRLSVIYKFESKYSLILYEILQRHADRRNPSWEWYVTMEDLRKLLGIEEKLPNYSDVEKRVLRPAQVEINSHAAFTVFYKPIRAGDPKPILTRGRGSKVVYEPIRANESKSTLTRGRGSKVVQVLFVVERKPLEDVKKPAALNCTAEVENSVDKNPYYVREAINFLSNSGPKVRRQWLGYAEAAGVKPPLAPTARENLPKWVPYIAEDICRREFFADFSRRKAAPPLATSQAKDDPS